MDLIPDKIPTDVATVVFLFALALQYTVPKLFELLSEHLKGTRDRAEADQRARHEREARDAEARRRHEDAREEQRLALSGKVAEALSHALWIATSPNLVSPSELHSRSMEALELVTMVRVRFAEEDLRKAFGVLADALTTVGTRANAARLDNRDKTAFGSGELQRLRGAAEHVLERYPTAPLAFDDDERSAFGAAA